MPAKFHGARLSELEEAAYDGMVEAGRETLRDARERAPKDTGKLRRSGRVVRDDLGVIVKFTAPHAHLQHENLDYQHPNGGEPKFLENAAVEVDLAEIVARTIRERMGGA